MDTEEVKRRQREERRKCLEDILFSPAKKKIIVSGPGTGKTYTFGELLKQQHDGNNLAMTFIRRLVADLDSKLSDYAEVKTFHAYCKKTLHQMGGKVVLVPYLTKIIKKDSLILEKNLKDFDTNLRNLKETSPEMEFYLKRGDYYKVVSFDDSVYRLLKFLQKELTILPHFDQIVIDEFQDFNTLEVAFIDELEKRGDILIVGDDDQAVYDDRSSSPKYIREKYNSDEYEKFPLPFSTRCTKVIVDTVNKITITSQQLGKLQGRIPKEYECYLDEKEADSIKYPYIIVVQTSTAPVLGKYIDKEISNIPEEEIIKSNDKENGYPTVIIAGPKHYLDRIYEVIANKYKKIFYAPSEGTTYSPIDAYELLLEDEQSNLGWRILVEYFDSNRLKDVIIESEKGKQVIKLLKSDFLTKHCKIIECLKMVKEGLTLSAKDLKYMQQVLGNYSKKILNYFIVEKEEEKEEEYLDREPTIILTSYKGCKGLSAGYVFITGMNNGDLPRDKINISDVEICQFIVALTRTRKCCYLLSTKWLIAPRNKRGWVPGKEESEFISWIPDRLTKNIGYITVKDLMKV